LTRSAKTTFKASDVFRGVKKLDETKPHDVENRIIENEGEAQRPEK
jgi:hypothetical protein